MKVGVKAVGESDDDICGGILREKTKLELSSHIVKRLRGHWYFLITPAMICQISVPRIVRQLQSMMGVQSPGQGLLLKKQCACIVCSLEIVVSNCVRDRKQSRGEKRNGGVETRCVVVVKIQAALKA